MIVRQYFLNCLSHASYLVADETSRRAVVIDPQRDIQQYLTDAAAEGLTIERVIETHFHADFLSGHLELAEATGAVISYGDAGRGKAEYPVDWLADGQALSLGEVRLTILATPGHTPESICIAAFEHADDTAPTAVFTGDTLFIGDVGRPDLLGGFNLRAEDLGRLLYHSLHDKLLTLPDSVEVYPAHGAGSACGKQLSDERVSTIGQQRLTNYALAPMSEEQFVLTVTEGQPAAPAYFPFAAVRNRQGHELLSEDAEVELLDLEAALAAQRDGAVFLDARTDTEFAPAHLQGAINVGLDGRFAEVTGQVVAPDTPIVLVGDPSTAREARIRLARIGFDRVVGQLVDPVRVAVDRPELSLSGSRVNATQLASLLESGDGLVLLDVRNPGEVATGVIEGSVLIPLAQLPSRLDELEPSGSIVVVCASGRRSSTAASFLRSRGWQDVSDLIGGFNGWAAAGRSSVQPTAAS